MIELEVTTQQGQFQLNVDSGINSQGITALFGPSGCGKSTLLRCIAGIQPAVQGHIRTPWGEWQSEHQSLPPWQREVGMVFQHGMLFPHLNVLGNLRYSARRCMQGASKKDIEQEVSRTAELCGIRAFLSQMPAQLSGGQQQRVAIARALLSQPQLLLLDEPLASLDASARREFMVLLRHVHQRTGLPMIYVSHQIEEIVHLADELMLMEQGRIVQSGSVQEVLTTTAGIELCGGLNYLRLHACEQTKPYALYRLADAGQMLELTKPSQNQRALVYADDIALSLKPVTQASFRNQLEAQVDGIMPHPVSPDLGMIRLMIDGQPMLACLSRHSIDSLALAPGQRVFALIKAVALH